MSKRSKLMICQKSLASLVSFSGFGNIDLLAQKGFGKKDHFSPNSETGITQEVKDLLKPALKPA